MRILLVAMMLVVAGCADIGEAIWFSVLMFPPFGFFLVYGAVVFLVLVYRSVNSSHARSGATDSRSATSLVNAAAIRAQSAHPLNVLGHVGEDEFITIVSGAHARGERLDELVWNGSAPIHIAVIREFPRALQHLLRLGADPDASDQFGLTAYDLARSRADRNFYECLVQHKGDPSAIRISDRPGPMVSAKEHNTEHLPGARKVFAGLETVIGILTIWIPATLAAIMLLIGIVTSNVVYIVFAVVVGIVVAFGWVRGIGTRDAANGK